MTVFLSARAVGTVDRQCGQGLSYTPSIKSKSVFVQQVTYTKVGVRHKTNFNGFLSLS